MDCECHSVAVFEIICSAFPAVNVNLNLLQIDRNPGEASALQNYYLFGANISKLSEAS